MATNTILLGGFTNCSAIAYGSQDISQVWFGNSLVWSATSSSATSAWVGPFPAGNTVAAAFTVPVSSYFNTATMILNTTQGWNFLNGIWTLTTDIGTALEVMTTQNVAPVNVGTLNSETAWKHTQNFAGTTILVPNKTYLIHIGYNYLDNVKFLNGNNIPYWAENWSFAGATTRPLTSASTSGIYLNVTTTPL
jgi:hypothetical protein